MGTIFVVLLLIGQNPEASFVLVPMYIFGSAVMQRRNMHCLKYFLLQFALSGDR